MVVSGVCPHDGSFRVLLGDDVNFHVSERPDGDGYLDITVSNQGACVIESDGHLNCWGNDFRGWVSDVPAGPFKTFDSACCHICALDVSGMPRCWGYAGVAHELAAPAGQPYEQIGVGTFYECGLRPDGEVDCWGWLGPVSTHYFGQDLPTAGPFNEVTVASSHACGRRLNGDMSCWGDDSGGQVSTVWSPNSPAAFLIDGFDGGDVVTCDVTAFDGIAVGNTATTSMTIESDNTAPSVSNVQVNPLIPTTNDALFVSYLFDDQRATRTAPGFSGPATERRLRPVTPASLLLVT